MPKPERVFLDWSEPTAPAAARWLAARPENPARVLVVVPSQQARRRLRAAFAGKPAPLIVTPAEFLAPAGEDLADPFETVLALAAGLATNRAARLPALFPAGVPARTFSERLALARSLRSLQAELAEHGLTVAEAATRLAPGSAEAARWRDLSQLLAAADRALLRVGRREPETSRLEGRRRPRLPAGSHEVVVVAAADLPPAIAHALELLREAVTVVVAAPDEPDAFDAWGRPLPGAWTERDPGWIDFEGQVRLVARPDGIGEMRLDSGPLEIGLLDRELLAGLTEALADGGRAIHDPTGLPFTGHWLVRTVNSLAALGEEPAFDRVVDLLRNGAMRAWLASRVAAFDPDAALAAADAILVAHFPATLRAARPWTSKNPALSAVLSSLEVVLAALRARPIETARQLAEELSAAFPPAPHSMETAPADPALASIQAALDRLQAASTHLRLSPADCLASLADAFADERLYPGAPPGAVEASGWLELPWSDAPRLLLAGMNLGQVPTPLGSEIFLTKGTRRSLGLPGAEERLARDAYFLARILARRGRVEAWVVQLDAEGSPLQPSPLLFAGAGPALPARVERLFAEARPPRPDPAWSAGWQLDPPVKELPRTISVTDFERYLDCPFTFYLRRAAGMRPFEPSADELDAAQFGDLVHFALEHWARDADPVADAAAISRSLEAHVSTWALRTVGRTLSLPLRVQLDSARARLHAFAAWQAADFRAGWRIRRIEAGFEDILGRPWELDGWKISGRVDRLDENENDGRWRVIDYKTFDAPDEPAKKHLRAFRPADRAWPPPYARVPDSADWWINLQLPLYRRLLVESGRPDEAIDCGYFNLPKTISETGLRLWDDLDGPRQTSALACARGVLADLARRKFWPRNPRAAHPDFAGFFPPDPARVVDPGGAFVRSCAP